MTTSLLIRFPWGRYHATPWGSHVNEARVELPPSPWRLLRALYSTWKLRRPDLSEGDVLGLLGRLAEPPMCFVPPHTVSTTRHYYPDSTHQRGVAGATDLTLDAFATIDPDTPVAFHWPFDLEPAQRYALEALAASMPYFGRADSLCEATVEFAWMPTPGGTFVPTDLDDTTMPDGGVVDVLAAVLPLEIESLVARPVDIRKRRLRFPEGSRLVPYRAVEPVPAPTSTKPRSRRPSTLPLAVRLAIVGPVQPPATEAVALADRLRRAALNKLGDPGKGDPQHSYLAGRGSDGTQLREAHQHAHFLPIVEDRRVTDLVVWAPGRLSAAELIAIEGVTYVWSGDRFTPPSSKESSGNGDPAAKASKIRVRATAVGSIDNVAPELVGPSARWISVSPYTSPRHLKGDERTFLEEDVRREAARRPWLTANVGSAQLVPPPSGASAPIEFVRARPSKRFARAGGRGADGGYGPGQAPPLSRFLELRFETDVAGPVALGHLSHFGLGLFTPAND